MKTILALSGSTRERSSNHSLLKAIAALSKNLFEVNIFDGLESLPNFNPDRDSENVPKEVVHFRQLVSNASGVIICTPEYAHGVPGSLKNAIDWTVSTSQFYNKPTLLITASTDGQYGHKALMETLKVLEAKNVEHLQMIIPFIKTKIKNDEVTDKNTLTEIERLISMLDETITSL